MTISAVNPSIRGPYIGQNGRTGEFLAHRGILTSALRHDLNAATTSATISNGGLSTITSTGAQVITMAAPAAGIEKIIVAATTSASTAARTVTLASGTFQSTTSSTYSTLTFNGDAQTISLIGLSTARFAVRSNAGVTLS